LTTRCVYCSLYTIGKSGLNSLACMQTGNGCLSCLNPSDVSCDAMILSPA